MSTFNNIKPPILNEQLGGLHPINQVKEFLLNLLKDYGFNEVDGPEIESEEFNFDMLNIKKSHPARQMHDTFYVQNKLNVLRTHTSPVQIRSMLNSKPPLAFTSAGKVYRKDDDSTHLPMFHQVEGIYVDHEVNFAQLKDLIHKIIFGIFGEEVKIRFRPSYFPFTEPSAEVDILSENGKWLEILGCGIVNPVVLDNCNIDSKKYSGLAFGLGVERIAMLKYEVNDIRDFYKSNLDFLSQFK
jgi:phenylalanyl-tRNA synthetase alpha chain